MQNDILGSILDLLITDQDLKYTGCIMKKVWLAAAVTICSLSVIAVVYADSPPTNPLHDVGDPATLLLTKSMVNQESLDEKKGPYSGRGFGRTHIPFKLIDKVIDGNTILLKGLDRKLQIVSYRVPDTGKIGSISKDMFTDCLHQNDGIYVLSNGVYDSGSDTQAITILPASLIATCMVKNGYGAVEVGYSGNGIEKFYEYQKLAMDSNQGLWSTDRLSMMALSNQGKITKNQAKVIKDSSGNIMITNQY
jgi:endonuclease YncB( thermonuclease family)